MKRGIYRNPLGMVLEVTDPVIGQIAGCTSLGGIWFAYTEPSPLGRDCFLVTEESFKQCGYEFISEGTGR